MKSILVAIFVVGMSLSLLIRRGEHSMECGPVLQAGETCHADYTTLNEVTIIGDVTIYNDSKRCPWWIDPELWWNQSCTGGLPPRLPVPEALR